MPVSLHYGVTNSLVTAALTLLSVPIIFSLGWLGTKKAFPHRVVDWLARNYRVAISLLMVAALAALVLCVWALRAFPNSGDEYVYLFQADTLLSGRLWNSLDPLHQYFSFSHIIEKDGKWVGIYTPGWPLILAGAKLIAIPPYAVSPICAVLLVLVSGRLYREVAKAPAAAIGTALLVLNAFFLMNGASYFAHIATALFGALFVLYGLRYLKNPTVLSSLIVGAALGAVGVIRPFSAILFAVPFVCELLLRGRYHFKTLVWILLAGLPFAVGLLAYNWLITGSPFLFVQHWGYPLEKIGIFPRDWWGNEFTLLDTSSAAIQRLVELTIWTSPFLIVLYLLAGYQKVMSRTLGFYDFIFPMFVVGYMLFPAVVLIDNRYGPRYYFEAFPFLILTIVSGLLPYLTSKSDKISATAFGLVLAALTLACFMIPIHLDENHRVVDERMGLYDAARREKISHAVVILRTNSGRIAPMVPMDLTRNGINIRDADIIFALSKTYSTWLRATGQGTEGGALDLAELMQAFPDRSFYVFEQQKDGQAMLRKLTRADVSNSDSR